jgi:hypothetical protein
MTALRTAGGGETRETIATLLQTAKMNNVDPLAWLSQTLTRNVAGPPPILSSLCRGTSPLTLSASNHLKSALGESAKVVLL